MLQRLLTLIAAGQQRSLAELAQKMEISPILLEEMLQQLVHQGYLEDLTCRTTGCDGCPAKGACFTGAHQRMWALTVKGRRAAGA